MDEISETSRENAINENKAPSGNFREMEFRLRANFDAILKDLEPSKYWNYLYQEGIFDEDDMDDVKTLRTRKKQAEELLGKVQRSGPEKITVFVNALNNTQPHLYELLQREIPGEQLQRQTGKVAGNDSGHVIDIFYCLYM